MSMLFLNFDSTSNHPWSLRTELPELGDVVVLGLTAL